MNLRDKLKFWLLLERIIDVITKGVPPIVLENAVEGSVSELTAYGDSTLLPTPYLDAVYANGKLETIPQDYIGSVSVNGTSGLGLPGGYTRVAYIQNTGNVYFNTGIADDVDDMEYEIMVRNLPSSGACYPFSSRNSTQIYGITGISGSGANIQFRCGGQTDLSYGIRRSDGVVNVYMYGKHKNGTTNISAYNLDDPSQTFTGTTTYTTYIADSENTGIGIWSNSKQYDNAGMKVYYARLRKQGKLVMNYIPCVRDSDSTPGFYDTVSKSFKTESNISAAPSTEPLQELPAPEPESPLSIYCNNGAVKVSPNLFNKNSYEEIDGYLDTSGIITVASSDNIQRCVVLSIKPNTTYYISGILDSRYGAFATKTVGSVASSFISTNGTITTGPNDNYIIGLIRTTTGRYDYRNTLQIEVGSTATPYTPYGITVVSGPTTVLEDTNGNTASVSDLYGISTYKDVQDLLTGTITRNVGIKVLDGTENWIDGGTNYYFKINELQGATSRVGLCTHLPCTNNNVVQQGYFTFGGATVNGNVQFGVINDYTSLASWKTYLSDQYAAGTPVIVLYPLATSTTESVSAQDLAKEPVSQTAGYVQPADFSVMSYPHRVPSITRPLKYACNNGELRVGYKNGLPLDTYTQVEYLQSSGTQYIDTGIEQGSASTYQTDVIYEYTTPYYSATSVCGHFSNTASSWGQPYGGDGKIWCGYPNTGYCAVSLSYGIKYYDSFKIDVVNGTITRTFNGNTYSASGITFTPPTGKCALFGCFTNPTTVSQRATIKCYGFKIYKDDVLVLNFIPARRNSDSVLGMYDTVSGTFFTNQGTGTFTAGSDVQPDVYTEGSLYTELEYIESTGTQYIDTGLAGNIAGNRYKIGFTRTGVSGTSAKGIIGTHNLTTPYNRSYIATATNQWEFGYETAWREGTVVNDTYYDIELDTTNSRYLCKTNGVAIRDAAYSGDRATANVLIGCVYQGEPTYCSIGKYHYAKIYDSDRTTLLMNLVPVKRNSDNAVGMYDRVSGKFFANAGTGTFIAGPSTNTVFSKETLTDVYGNTATVEDVFALAGETLTNSVIVKHTSIDSHEVVSGTITHNVGVKILTGNESYTINSGRLIISMPTQGEDILPGLDTTNECELISAMTHGLADPYYQWDLTASTISSAQSFDLVNKMGWSTATDAQNWVKQQFQDGTPFIVFYPKSTSSTESTTTQYMKKSPVTISGGYNYVNIPDGYSEITSLVNLSTMGAEGTPYIDTGLVATKDYSFLAVGTFSVFSHPTLGNTNGIELTGDSSNYVLKLGGTNNVIPSVTGYPNHCTIFNYDSTNSIFVETCIARLVNPFSGGDTKNYSADKGIITTSGSSTPTTNLLLFKSDSDTSSTTGNLKLKSMKIWDNTGTLVRDYIAVKRDSDGELGLYDLENNVFYTNSGTGKFSVDPEDLLVKVDDLTFTESTYTTPAPNFPLDMCCNNGVLKLVNGTLTSQGPVETLQIHSPNLFNPATSVDLEYINSSNGRAVSNSDWRRSDYIEVRPSTQYYFSQHSDSDTVAGIAWYDEDKVYISGTYASDIAFYNGVITSPSTAKYVRISFNRSNAGGASFNTTVYFCENGLLNSFMAYDKSTAQTASCEDLYKVSTYQDTQEILTGTVSRNVGIKVFDGTENWNWGNPLTGMFCNQSIAEPTTDRSVLCNQFKTQSTVPSSRDGYCIKSSEGYICIGYDALNGDVTAFKAYLAQQYAQGTPVVIIYPLANTSTESVSSQAINTGEGTHVLDMTQAGKEGLEVQVAYKKRG